MVASVDFHTIRKLGLKDMLYVNSTVQRKDTPEQVERDFFRVSERFNVLSHGHLFLPTNPDVNQHHN